MQSEVEQESVVLFNSRSKVSSDVDADRGKKDNIVRNAADMRGRSTERQPLKPKDNYAVSFVELWIGSTNSIIRL